VPREQADHDQHALTAVRTELTGLERGIRAGERLALPVWGREGCGRFVACQAELELVQERPMDGTPEPIIADFVEPLGQHMLEKAANELQRRQGHGFPAMVLGILVAR
jgi:hypothetical protein